MDVTPKLLEDVEFREKFRGYDPEEVDDFLERVAVAFAQLHEKVRDVTDQVESANARAARAEARARDSSDTDDTLRRTLVLAQRTADAAINEAEESAAAIVAAAEAQARQHYAAAEDHASHVTAQAETASRASAVQAEAEVAEKLRLADSQSQATLAGAREQASRLLVDARQKSDRMVVDAESAAIRHAQEKLAGLTEEVGVLERRRDALVHDVHALDAHAALHRDRMSTLLGQLREVVEGQTSLGQLTPPALGSLKATPAGTQDEASPLLEAEPEPTSGSASAPTLTNPLSRSPFAARAGNVPVTPAKPTTPPPPLLPTSLLAGPAALISRDPVGRDDVRVSASADPTLIINPSQLAEEVSPLSWIPAESSTPTLKGGAGRVQDGFAEVIPGPAVPEAAPLRAPDHLAPGGHSTSAAPSLEANPVTAPTVTAPTITAPTDEEQAGDEAVDRHQTDRADQTDQADPASRQPAGSPVAAAAGRRSPVASTVPPQTRPATERPSSGLAAPLEGAAPMVGGAAPPWVGLAPPPPPPPPPGSGPGAANQASVAPGAVPPRPAAPSAGVTVLSSPEAPPTVVQTEEASSGDTFLDELRRAVGEQPEDDEAIRFFEDRDPTDPALRFFEGNDELRSRFRRR